MTKCSEMDIFHFFDNMSCSALNVSNLRIKAVIFHVHQYRGTLTAGFGRLHGRSNKHVKGSADMWKPVGAFNLGRLQDVYLQLIGDGFQSTHTLWTIVVCFPD